MATDPCLPGATRLRGIWFSLHWHWHLQPTVTSLSAFHVPCCMLHSVSCIQPTGGRLVPHGSTFLPPSSHVLWILVPASQTMEFNEIPSNSQYLQKSSKWCLETSKDLQNEVSKGAWNHQNQENIRKVKSKENNTIYNVFERLGHQKSTDFPIKNHSESCLQSKHAFWRLGSHKIWKSDPRMVPKGHPKFIKNRYKSSLGHSRALLNEPWHQMITKLMPKWSPRTPKWSKMVPQNT